MTYYLIKYTGPFGFIKPWTAVRDSETFSQQFLTPSIVEGIEKKLFPEMLKETGIHKIQGHRLSYDQVSSQQEVIQTKGWNVTRKGFVRPTSVIKRGVLLNPVLYLAFVSEEDTRAAYSQHICLCRNEDLLYPAELIVTTRNEFEQDQKRFPGYELVFEKNEGSFLVGYHRLTNEKMYGWIRTVGHPVRTY